MSRPSEYSEERAAAICALIAEGLSLRQIAAREGMPDKTTILRWLSATNADGTPRHPDFRTQYARAREMQADHFVDEILEIADDGSNDWIERELKNGNVVTVVDHEHVGRSKLRVDARKWLMAKLAPKKYGDRVSAELSGPDGGPIQTENLSDLEVARRVAFLLSRATQQTPQE
jgi:transposase